MGFKVTSRKESCGVLADEMQPGQFTAGNAGGVWAGSLEAGAVIGAGGGVRAGTGSGGLQKQYFSDPSRAYAAQYGDIADNVYAARCQGLDPSDFFAWTPILIRSSNTEFTGYTSSRPDDTQRIYVLKPENVTELRAGALLEYGNNLWMVFRTRNLGVPRGSAILRRCNTLTNVVMAEAADGAATGTDADAEPRLVSVPLILESADISSALPYTTQTDSLAAGTLRCYCQRCPATDSWQENTRIILGRSAFLIRGLNDFTREHTNERMSARVLSFTLARTSPQPVDSIEHQCADYHLYFKE